VNKFSSRLVFPGIFDVHARLSRTEVVAWSTRVFSRNDEREELSGGAGKPVRVEAEPGLPVERVASRLLPSRLDQDSAQELHLRLPHHAGAAQRQLTHPALQRAAPDHQGSRSHPAPLADLRLFSCRSTWASCRTRRRRCGCSIKRVRRLLKRLSASRWTLKKTNTVFCGRIKSNETTSFTF